MPFLSFLLALTVYSTSADAQARPYTPPRGSVEREQIMDAFRAPVARRIGRSIIFQNVRMRVQDGWAFVVAEPRSPSGRPVLNLESPHCVPICTEQTLALLRWRRGRWVVIDYEVSPGEFPTSWQGRFPDVPRGVWAWNWSEYRS